jgi:hypothetical protein
VPDRHRGVIAAAVRDADDDRTAAGTAFGIAGGVEDLVHAAVAIAAALGTYRCHAAADT